MSDAPRSLVGEQPPEAIPGLPAHLPAGEYVVWQGAPDWKDLAINGFHARKLSFYFALLLLARVVVQTASGAALIDTVASTATLALLAGAVIGFIALYAWLAARAARYTVTNQRLVIRCGATLPMTINLPFAQVESADLRVRPNDRGDLPLTLKKGERPSWVILWPHVKPFSITRVRPMLRSVPEAQAVGQRVGDALRAHAEESSEAVAEPRVVREAPSTLANELSASPS